MNTLTEKRTQIEVELNVPQFTFNLIQPHIGVCVWARATGKSEGPVASYVYNCVTKMPGSNGFIQGATYASVEGKIVPALKSGLLRLGLEENKHYWIEKKPPAHLHIPPSLRDPATSYKHYIKFWNGTGVYLLSQDKASLSNGIRTQWGVVDEAKLINKQDFDAVTAPTMAGGDHLWGEQSPFHLAEYQSILFCTDMPNHSSGKWILDYEKLMEPNKIDLILQAQLEIEKLKVKLKENPKDIYSKNELKEYQKLSNELRRQTVYFSMANAIDNIGFIGMDYLKNQRTILEDTKYRLQILNQKLIRDEKGFYFAINPDENGYPDLINYSYYDTLNGTPPYQRDCRWDGDINTSAPLEIAFDHNSILNCVVTAQETPSEVRLLNSMWVMKPQKLKDCITQWHEYYKYHQKGNKNLYYWHDATSIGDNNKGDIPTSTTVVNMLAALGWNVIIRYIGQIGSHKSRHHFWEVFATQQEKRLPKFRYNRTNAASWETSAFNAGVIKLGNKLKKDKSSERPDSSVHPSEATHLSEAADILFYGKYRELYMNVEAASVFMTTN